MQPRPNPSEAVQTNAIQTDAIQTNAIQTTSSSQIDSWFDYPVTVQPHHTDYAGVVWHGSYVTWMEEARIECLRSLGLDYADVVNMGCELPVIELSIRYHRALQFGRTAVVKTRMDEIKGVRLNWEYRIQSPDEHELYVTAKVTLVAIDRARGKIMRQLPTVLKETLLKLSS